LLLLWLVLIIDDAQKDYEKKIVMEFTFVQPVMSVRLRTDRCVVNFVFPYDTFVLIISIT